MTERERQELRKRIDAAVRAKVDKTDKRKYCIECGELIKQCTCRQLIADLMTAIRR